MVYRIFKKAETLSKNPESGRKESEANREEMRKVFKG